MEIRFPCLLFLGDATDPLSIKTAKAMAFWRKEHCTGQLGLPACKVSAGLPSLDIAEARALGVQSLVIGLANRSGLLHESWKPVLLEAIEAGLDIVSPMHSRLSNYADLKEVAERKGVRLIDVRIPDRAFLVGTGRKRSGLRLLTVGTDCSTGKMYTALSLEKEMQKRGLKATFRATGQTGILIAGTGVAVDAVVSDFVSGATEDLCPDNDPDHWDLIEGQGSLFHASYAGVSLGLLHGSQPDALVLCHEPHRPHMRGLPDYALPDLAETMELNLRCARLTNPEARFVGISCNTSGMEEKAALAFLTETESRFNLPCVDPVRQGVGRIVDALEQW